MLPLYECFSKLLYHFLNDLKSGATTTTLYNPLNTVLYICCIYNSVNIKLSSFCTCSHSLKLTGRTYSEHSITENEDVIVLKSDLHTTNAMRWISKRERIFYSTLTTSALVVPLEDICLPPLRSTILTGHRQTSRPSMPERHPPLPFS